MIRRFNNDGTIKISHPDMENPLVITVAREGGVDIREAHMDDSVYIPPEFYADVAKVFTELAEKEQS